MVWLSPRMHDNRSGQRCLLSINVILAEEEGETEIGEDGWTATAESGCLAALFTAMVAITGGGPQLLTPIP